MTELIHAPVTSKEIGEFSKRDPIFFIQVAFQSNQTIQTIFLL